MKAANSLHFKRMFDLKYEFIPQLALMLCLFGWMDLLIIVKWLTNWEGRDSRAPGIVSIMINMFLRYGEVNEETTDALIDSYSMQQTLCIAFLITAIICIPSMLLLKPYYIYKDPKTKHSRHVIKDIELKEHIELSDAGRDHSIEEIKQEKSKGKIDHNELDLAVLMSKDISSSEHGMGEIFIHQLIETIEFALGTVSNTASYLRLWALSLAHGQLAEVFFQKLLASLALSGHGSGVLMFLLFPFFASFSFFVLM